MVILPEFLIDQPGQPPRRGWGVQVMGDTIAAVAPHDELRGLADTEILEAPRHTLSPGFFAVDALSQDFFAEACRARISTFTGPGQTLVIDDERESVVLTQVRPRQSLHGGAGA